MRLLLALCSLTLAGVGLCLAPCDDAKFNIKIDLPDMKSYQCPDDPWPVLKTMIPSLVLRYPEQEALQFCMDQKIEYNLSIPNSGAHRPSRARYGEYEFCPPQRWVNNLQHGAVAFLYHPCVNPILKEELRLLASACFYKHVITPHVSLTKDRPLAMASWTATLEMQRLNLTEAMAWLQESVGRAPEHQVKNGDVYDYLLTRPALMGLRDINKKLCGEYEEMLKEHFELPESRQDMGKIEWGVEHAAIRLLKLMTRRKRRVSVESYSNRASPKVSSMLTAAEHLEGQSGDALRLRAGVDGATTHTAKKLRSEEHSQTSWVNRISRDYDRTMLGLGGSSSPRGGFDGENGTEFTLSVLEDTEHARINHQEGKNVKEIVGEEESLRSAVQGSRYGVSSTHNSETIKIIGSFRVIKALVPTGTGYGAIKGTLQSTAPLPDSSENLEMNNTSRLPPLPDHVEQSTSSVKGASNQKILQEGGLHKVNDSEPLERFGNPSQILVSSEPDESKKNGANHDSTSQNEQGILTKDNRASTTKDIQGAIVKLEITHSKNRSSFSVVASEKGAVGEEGTGKDQCNCVKGALHELESHNHQQAMAQAGMLGNSKHTQEGEEVARAAVDTFVRTPRTEEAAWAAAALTFLFVLLTLAVLYTRLWRKFRKSESLYWAPDGDQEGQETVSAVIKRRLTVGQGRRKKRQNYKKRPLVLYEDFSDSSD